MQGLQRYLQLMNMTLKKESQSFGPPPVLLDLTLEQQLKLRQIELILERGEFDMKDLGTIFLALQEQCFVLSNNVSNLVKQWPHLPTTAEDESMSGILSAISRLASTEETQ